MNFKTWKNYWRELGWSRRWFALFILLRPIVDNFYFIKQYSSFLSPIYIVGVLTPFLAVVTAYDRKMKRPVGNVADDVMTIWGLTILLNCAILLAYQYSLDNFGDSIKYITPPLLFLYLRRFVRSKEDLQFVLTTFMISCIYPFGMLAFELLVHPIDPQHLAQGRGGGTRLRGEYGDSMAYAIYFIGLFLSAAYFFLDKVYARGQRLKPGTWKLAVVFIACVVGIISIKHVSTWAVFLTLQILFVYFNAKNMKGLGIMVFLGLIVLPFFARTIYEEQIYPLVAKEYTVVSGEKDVEFGFNGRISRWERYFAIWNDMPLIAKVAGTPFSGKKEASVMIGGGMHNDFVRILFLTGFIGLFLYLLVFFSVLSRIRYFRVPERFLILGSIAVIFLYSISTLPTIYMGLMNYIFPIFCFSLLPRKVAYGLYAVPIQERLLETAVGDGHLPSANA